MDEEKEGRGKQEEGVRAGDRKMWRRVVTAKANPMAVAVDRRKMMSLAATRLHHHLLLLLLLPLARGRPVIREHVGILTHL